MRTTEATSSTPATVQCKSTTAPFFQPEESRDGFFSSSQNQQPFFQPAPPAGNNSKPGTIQTKLTIGAPDDVYEQEADAMADKVVQHHSAGETGPMVQRKCAECAQEEESIAPKLQRKSMFESNEEPSGEQVQRKCAACEAEEIQPMRIQRMEEEEEPSLQEKKIQRVEEEESTLQEKRIQRMGEEEEPQLQEKKIQRMTGEEEPELQAKSEVPSLQASPDLESRLAATKGGGSPLPDTTRTSMESSFGKDFSNVRVHNNSGAVQMNQELGAQAFAHGSDIYFNSGKYDPESSGGQHLLAHELTHTVQQGGSPNISNSSNSIQRMLAVIDIDAIAEEIHTATAGWGTDEERIFVNLQRLKKDPGDVTNLNATYKTKYAIELEAELRDEMSGNERRLALELIGINDHPAQGNLANPAMPSTSAEFTTEATRLKNAIEGLGTDEETIYAALLPFQRNNANLTLLKSAYKTLTTRELQTDIEDDMSGSELHYALYLLNGLPNETTIRNPTITPGANVHTGVVPGGTVNVETGVQIGSYNDMFSMNYTGGIANDSRWLQFIWREILVTHADGSVTALLDTFTNSAGKTYGLTTDPNAPNFNTDTASATNPFYEAGFLYGRTADSTTMFDMPGSADNFIQREFANGATNVTSRAHFNTFLVRDYRPLYQISLNVEWTYNSPSIPPRVHSVTNANSVNHLPDAMRATLVRQYPTYSYIE